MFQNMLTQIIGIYPFCQEGFRAQRAKHINIQTKVISWVLRGFQKRLKFCTLTNMGDNRTSSLTDFIMGKNT